MVLQDLYPPGHPGDRAIARLNGHALACFADLPSVLYFGVSLLLVLPMHSYPPHFTPHFTIISCISLVLLSPIGLAAQGMEERLARSPCQDYTFQPPIPQAKIIAPLAYQSEGHIDATHTQQPQAVIKNNSLPQRLSNSEIQAKMQDIPDWNLNGTVIQSQRQFRDFVEAIAFVNRLVEPAEAANHHPDIAISYNTVTITLTTHDVGGLTEQDFAMAEVISDIQ